MNRIALRVTQNVDTCCVEGARSEKFKDFMPLKWLVTVKDLSISPLDNDRALAVQQPCEVSMRPCMIQCTFDCHRVDNIFAPLFVYVGPLPLGSK